MTATTRRRVLVAPVLLLTVLAGWLFTARPASAHPLDVYLQSSYLTISATSVDVELDLSPGVLVAPAVLSTLDVDGDRDVSRAEARTYAANVLAEVTVEVDGTAWDLRMTAVDTPSYLVLQAGYGTLRVHATASGSGAGGSSQHSLTYRNGFTGADVSYQVNAYLDDAVTVDRQQRSDTQQQSTITYTAATGGTADSRADDSGEQRTAASTTAATTGRLAGYLESSSLSWWLVLVALAAAVLLGALHALTPGHAKTLMAAYLVGGNGTSRDAATLGAVVTFTHTASVIVIGLIALLASRFLVPGVLVPSLEIASGLIVVVLGLRLLRQRWRARAAVRDHVPTPHLVAVEAGAHDQDHDHDHAAGHSHSHGGRTHTHTHELPAGGVSVRSLVAMGVSGGMVPCPEALGVMVVAVGVGRTVLGLGLIVAFSLGLAAVLIGFGVLLVRCRSLVIRLQRVDSRWLTSALPFLSAAVVTALGVGLVVTALGHLAPVT